MKLKRLPGGALRVPVTRLIKPFQLFFRLEAAGGIVLLLFAAAAMVWANSPAAGSYERLFGMSVTIGWAPFAMAKPLLLWINDGLMAVFFLVVGLEIKREILVGELASPRLAALPLAAAIGGMIVPALIYAGFASGGEGARGWGVPMATDIAFSLGVLALLGRRVPPALRVFLVGLAIADDLGAVLVIAIFYGHAPSLSALAAAGVLLLVLSLANAAGFRWLPLYLVIGGGLWFAVLKSGVHPTVAGVLLAMTIPARTGGEPKGLLDHASPLLRLEHALLGWVAFVIMPIFALANAGVSPGGGFDVPGAAAVGMGVAAGLLMGKPLGIGLACWLAVRGGLAELPAGLTWRHIVGTGFLAGIGFTMSLFIAGLAFGDSPLLQAAKLSILGASLLAGIVGWLILWAGGRSTVRA